VRVARSFWLIPEIIPLPARDDVAVLYCVCRHLDDAVDEAGNAAEARAVLGRWRDELAGRAAPRPLVAAFLAGAPRTGLPLACVDHLLDGLEFDLGPVRIADDEELLRYAYRVSAAVGLMVAPLVGVRGGPAEARVVDLGVALQISNVLYVRGDARRGRVYLPARRLAAVGLRPEDVLAAPGDPRLLPLLRDLASLADVYYRSASLGAAFMPLRYRHGVILFARTYRALGRRAAGGDAEPEMPRQLPFSTKALRLAELLVTAWDPRTLGLRSPPPHDRALHRAFAGWPGSDGAAASRV
jgi:phytoene synthase